jgi:hypothetical protein
MRCGVVNCELLDDGVRGIPVIGFSTGKVNKGVLDPQCILWRRFPDTDGG